MSHPLLIVGAGGHAAVVVDALLASGQQVLGLTDPDAGKHGTTVCGVRVLGDDSRLLDHDPALVKLVNGVGGLRADGMRHAAQQRLERRGWSFASVQHPSAVVSPFARIEPGVHLMAGCIVQANARVGRGSIVNTRAIVEHDAILDEFVHVAPAAVVCGGATVGANSHVGAGAVVLQSVALGEDTTIGAGAVVLHDSPGRQTLCGVPARLLE